MIWVGLTLLAFPLQWILPVSELPFLLRYYLMISVSTGALYCWDKLIAPSAESVRVPEYLFLFASVLGASLSLLALSLIIRHKIRKRKFQMVLLIMTIFHGLAILSLHRSGAL
jgi:uncharacterized membrane protein YsdA (DUF1294 family)